MASLGAAAPPQSPSRRHYFDWAATAIPDSAATGTAPAGAVVFGNPSSLHSEGRRARQALEDARSRCAAVLHVPPKNIYFTSGGTESNAMALHSLLLRPQSARVL
jgi:cysteine desulfurase